MIVGWEVIINAIEKVHDTLDIAPPPSDYGTQSILTIIIYLVYYNVYRRPTD